SPSLAENITIAIAFNADRDACPVFRKLPRARGPERRFEFATEGIILPAGDVRRPDPPAFRIGDAGNGHADGANLNSSRSRGLEEIFDFALDQSPDPAALTPFQSSHRPGDYPSVAAQNGCGQLCSTQVKCDNGHAPPD